MQTTTNFNIRKMADNEGDKPQAVNDGFDDIDAALQIVKLTAPGNGSGTGTGATFSAVAVPANRYEWTDTGVVLGPDSAVAVRASGKIAYNDSSTPYAADEQGPAPLVLALVPEGAMPTDGMDVDGQVFYLYTRAFANEATDQTFRLIAKVRDVGGNGDNQGTLYLTLAFFADRNRAFSIVGHVHQQGDVAGLPADLTAIRNRLSAGGL